LVWISFCHGEPPLQYHIKYKKYIIQETLMFKQSLLSAVVMAALAVAPVQAQDKISGGVVKIGVLTDLSGLYMGNVGPGSVLATKLAIEEFGGKVAGKPIELVVADHLNKADVAAARARGCVYQVGTDMLFEQIPAYLEFFGFRSSTPDELRALAEIQY
jgi:hypothetical protein